MSEKIEVTPNVMKCLEVLREAVKALPEGNLKIRVQGAVEYLEEATKGEPQPNDGVSCPGGKIIIPTGG